MLTVKDAEHLVMLISILGGLFCARLWSVAVVAVIAGLLFPTLLTLFVSPYGKRALFRDAGRQFYSAGRLFHCDLRDICFWRAFTPACHWNHRPEMASTF
jgi:hypothetical protein